MKIALIGLPASGKSTCFSALTGLQKQPAGAGERVGVVSVPEPRLDRVATIYSSKKVVYPEVIFLDTAALADATSAEEAAKHLVQVGQEADALAIVVRCFGELNHRGEKLDSRADLETVVLELALADLGAVDRRLERLKAEPKKERSSYEEYLLQRLREHLAAAGLIFQMSLSHEEEKLLGGYNLVTSHPLLVVCNVADDDLEGRAGAGACDWAEEVRLPYLHFCAPLEAELAQLPVEEQKEFLRGFDLEQPARERFLKAAYELLGTVTFLTAREKEARAWPVPRNTRAPQAAGKVHTDMERGFIRAEVVAFTDLDTYGSLAECRKHGLVRLEGKDYVVQDGDILDIRFSR